MAIREKIEATYNHKASFGSFNSAVREMNRKRGWEVLNKRKKTGGLPARFNAYNSIWEVSLSCTFLKSRKSPWVILARRHGKQIGRAVGSTFKEAWGIIQKDLPGVSQ